MPNTTDTDTPVPPSAEMNRRMAQILHTPGNDVCADCPAKHPLWVSFLVSPVEEDRHLGILTCTTCAQHHHFELGEKRTIIKYLKMAHEWDWQDMERMEDSGNAFVNACFEAHLKIPDDFDKNLVIPASKEDDSEDEEDIRRGKFIKQKYKKLKWFDETLYHQQVLQVLKRKHEQRSKQKEHDKKQQLTRKSSKKQLTRNDSGRDKKQQNSGRDNDSSTHSSSSSSSSDSRNSNKSLSSAGDIMRRDREKRQGRSNSARDLFSSSSSKGRNSTPKRTSSSGRKEDSRSSRNEGMRKAHSMKSLNLSSSSVSRRNKKHHGSYGDLSSVRSRNT